MIFGSQTSIFRLLAGIAFSIIYWWSCETALAQGSSQQVVVSASHDLRRIFDAAWARQPEALALKDRRAAAEAKVDAARAWAPEPAALELAYKTDQVSRNQGAREFEAGVSMPLWLPGEQRRNTALAQAELTATESGTAAAQLRVAATVREAWWQWQLARIETEIARDQLKLSRQLATDVDRRVKAGELARADQHQADGAVAIAEANLAQANVSLTAAQQQIYSIAGAITLEGDVAGTLSEADPSPFAADVETHAQVLDLKNKATVAHRVAELTAIQVRANPELTIAITQDRGAFTESFQRSISVGVRIPFGGGSRHVARAASATAEAMEAHAQLDLERERLNAEREAAKARVEATKTQLAAAERRVLLARESRSFFEKSFRLGETDLPTRLRIEAEAAEAERQAARSRIEVGAALSAWRQTLGLLPQ